VLKKLSKNVKATLSILFTIIGLYLILCNYFIGIKENVFTNKNMALMSKQVVVVENLEEINEIDYEPTVDEFDDRKDNYIGYLEVPDVSIRRGFVAENSKYNSVGYNVMLVSGSDMPTKQKGNLILAAHRGNSAVSFFDKLYLLKENAQAKIYYRNKVYTYELKNSYTVPKVGTLEITRNEEKTTLTLITCTRDDKTTQTIFNFELVSEGE